MKNPAKHADALRSLNRALLKQAKPEPIVPQEPLKALVRAVAHRPIDERVIADTAERIAAVRASDEAREGIAAFLSRRSPAWVPESLRRGKGEKE